MGCHHNTLYSVLSPLLLCFTFTLQPAHCEPGLTAETWFSQDWKQQDHLNFTSKTKHSTGFYRVFQHQLGPQPERDHFGRMIKYFYNVA